MDFLLLGYISESSSKIRTNLLTLKQQVVLFFKFVGHVRMFFLGVRFVKMLVGWDPVWSSSVQSVVHGIQVQIIMAT